jgi:hypothetical protein
MHSPVPSSARMPATRAPRPSTRLRTAPCARPSPHSPYSRPRAEHRESAQRASRVSVQEFQAATRSDSTRFFRNRWTFGRDPTMRTDSAQLCRTAAAGHSTAGTAPDSSRGVSCRPAARHSPLPPALTIVRSPAGTPRCQRQGCVPRCRQTTTPPALARFRRWWRRGTRGRARFRK